MDLTQIRHFLALARTLNFTRAAEACNVTQPAPAKSIQRLEEELGGPLLLRERALTQLTPLGRAMLPLLEQTHAAAERAKEHAAGLKLQASCPLRVGFAPMRPRRLLRPCSMSWPPACRGSRSRWPRPAAPACSTPCCTARWMPPSSPARRRCPTG